MNWQEKFMAIKSVVKNDAHIEMSSPDNWYVSASMEHAEGEGCLIGDYGEGVTPQIAIENHWKLYGDGRPFFSKGKWLRWNGFMFEDSERPNFNGTRGSN